MYKVKNKTDDPRKFWDHGKDIVVLPGKTIETEVGLPNNNIWKVEEIKEKTIKKTKEKKEFRYTEVD